MAAMNAAMKDGTVQLERRDRHDLGHDDHARAALTEPGKAR
jgi:hypothetical protein